MYQFSQWSQINTFLNIKHIIIMNPVEQKQLIYVQIDKATSRRSRKDEEGRDFQCGCGKRYLSYPALYTHIKTKHDGRQPEGTQKTGTNMGTKRPKVKLQEETLKSIYNYMQKQDLKLLGQLDESNIGAVPLSSRLKKQSVAKQIYECYAALMKQQECRLNKCSTLDLVLTVYLLNVGEYVNQKLFDHYLLFAKLIRSCYLQNGEQVYKACFSKQGEGVGYISQFSNTKIKYFPIICDYLLRYYISVSEIVKQYKEINLSLIQLMLYDFCQWLLKYKLTFIRVTLKKEYRLQTKPVTITKTKNLSNRNGAKANDNSQQQELEQSASEELKKQNGEEIDEEQSSQNEQAEEECQPQQQGKINESGSGYENGQSSNKQSEEQKQKQKQIDIPKEQIALLSNAAQANIDI